MNEYRKIKRELGLIEKAQDEIINRENYLEANSRKIICELENNIDNLYTPEGLYIAFVAGWLPVPELWSDSPEFSMAKNWDTSIIDGAKYITENNVIMPTERLINKCVSNIPEAKRILKDKYSVCWKDFEVINDEQGRPYLTLYNVDTTKIESIDVSISHCKLYATANVTVLFK